MRDSIKAKTYWTNELILSRSPYRNRNNDLKIMKDYFTSRSFGLRAICRMRYNYLVQSVGSNIRLLLIARFEETTKLNAYKEKDY
jgi:hypothetical protein